MSRIIINCDDFGYNPEMNHAISTLYSKNHISSTSMLVNFESGFVSAIEYIESGRIQRNSIGIHLNLTQGKPLTPGIAAIPRFCHEGKFHGRARSQSIFMLSIVEKKAIREELNAQIEKFLSLGFSPSHIDSHHHIHSEWAIMLIVKKVALSYKIPRLRIGRNIGKNISFPKRVYKMLLNKYLHIGKLSCTKYFGSINDFIDCGIPATGTLEIMVHAYFSGEEIVDMDRISLERKISTLFGNTHPKLMSYSELN